MSDQMNPSGIPEALRATAQAAITAPHPVVDTKITKYYYCTLPNTCMHREDGQKLAFVFNICKTSFKYDQEYLDKEIDKGHPHLRFASEEEIHTFNMRINPRETMKQELLSDPKVRQELEDKIRAEMAGIPTKVTDEQRVQGTESSLSKLRDGIKSGSGTILPSTSAPQPPQRLNPISTADIAAGAKESGK